MSPAIDEHTALLIFSAVLNLTDAQQQQLGNTFDAAVKTAAPLNTQIENGKNALFEAVRAGKTAGQLKALSDQEGALTSQLIALQTQTFAAMYAMLISDQKLMVDDSMFTDIGQFLSNAREPLPETTSPAATPRASAAEAPGATP
jgi:hypothetical protein